MQTDLVEAAARAQCMALVATVALELLLVPLEVEVALEEMEVNRAAQLLGAVGEALVSVIVVGLVLQQEAVVAALRLLVTQGTIKPVVVAVARMAVSAAPGVVLPEQLHLQALAEVVT